MDGRVVRRWSIPVWAWAWLLLVVAMLFARAPLPIDETRYLSVAWDMWQHGSVWVPLVNGHTYDGKPPLFFWLVDLGWLVFGVTDWWGRLVAPLFGLLSLFVTAALARRLWNERAAALAPWLLLGSLYWALFTSSSMIDMLLVAFVLLAILGLVRVWEGGGARYFVYTGLALGLGVLAKGPVVYLPVAFVVVLAPWWMNATPTTAFRWRSWYLGALGALGVSALVIAGWLVPMMLSTGPKYFLDMVVYQTVGYMGASGPVAMNAHLRPFWWYVPLLPLLLFPWSFWPPAWRAFRMRGALADPGVRLTLAWMLPSFVALSLIGGKQPHYLLPLFPALALLLARRLGELREAPGTAVPGVLFLLAGALWLALPLVGPAHARHAPWLAAVPISLSWSLGAILIALGAVLMAWRGRRDVASEIRRLTACTLVGLFVNIAGVFHVAWPAYDLRPASDFLHSVTQEGASLAVLEYGYHGEFNFLGRLTRPLDEIDAAQLPGWLANHDDGYVIAVLRPESDPSAFAVPPDYRQLFRGQRLAIWSSRQLLENPYLARQIHRSRGG